MSGLDRLTCHCIRRSGLAIVGFVLAAAACVSSDTGTVPDVNVTDSAAVRIVEFSMDVREAPDYQLREPSVSLSGEGEPGGYYLNRVVDAVPLPDGGLAVANAGNREILIFNAVGQLQRRLGRAGSGPGEYRVLAWLGLLPPDSLVIGDIGLRRVTVYGPDGLVARTEAAAGESPDTEAAGEFAPQPIGVFRDGTIALTSYGSIERTPGPTRRTVTLLRYDPEGRTTQTLGSVAGDELHLLPHADRLDVLQPPFARTGIIRIGGEAYYMADSDLPQAAVHSVDGDVQAVIRWRESDRTITDQMFDVEMRYRFREIEDGPALEQRLREQREMAAHKTLPSLGSMHLGTDGRVWISRYSLSTDSLAWWYGVDATAGAVVTLAVPRASDVLCFGEDEVIVLGRDDLDRETIERYSLRRR